jgi:hypothetical protein
MVRKTLNIIVFILLCRSFSGFGQNITIDTSMVKGENLYFVFNSDAVDNASVWNSPVPGDYYRVKYMNNSLAATDTDSRFIEGKNTISIPKDSILKNEITGFSDISITFLKADRGCWVKVSDIESLQRGDTLYITRMSISPQRVTYERRHACENDPAPISPTVTENLKDVEFWSSGGLNIDRYTGTIVPAEQAPGKYPVDYNCIYCLESNSDTILINPAPAFSIERHRRLCEGRSIELSPSAATENDVYTWSDGSLNRNTTVSSPGTYTVTAENEFGCTFSDTVNVELKTIEIEQIEPVVTPADCYQEGSVSFSRLDISNGELPYTYRFENRVSKQLLQNPDRLKEGDYILTIEDADGCQVTAQKIISVRKDCLNDYPVFTPNTDGMDDDYYIPYEGEAVVYDRNGTERHRFMAPAYWDGRDDNGNPLPMGTYLIVVGKKEMINITIIK